jgi:hypothetical protein
VSDTTHRGLAATGDRGVPAGVDEAAVRRMRAVGHLLDDAVRVPGTNVRVGLDPLLGILPVAGDTVAAALSLYIVVESARLGVSTATMLRMLGNVAVDLVVGSVPILGDLFDAAWRANRRNVELALADLGPEPVAAESTGTD